MGFKERIFELRNKNKVDGEVVRKIFLNDYISSNQKYFSELLGDRIGENFKLNKEYLQVLKEAYDKAHRIREIELDLFWKRAVFCLTLIAGFITLAGVVSTSYFRNPSESGDLTTLWTIVTISLFGGFFTYLSNLVVIGGEYWKRNWEMHVVMLEPFFSGRLYSTHLVNSSHRASIVKVITALFYFIYFFWILVLSFSLLTIFKSDSEKLMRALVVLFWGVTMVIVFLGCITSSKNRNIEVYITDYKVSVVDKPELPKLFFLRLANIFRIIFVGVVVIILSMCAMEYFLFGNFSLLGYFF
ncbi:hypothetical protein [Pantoea stewartii]|uniref:RipA family octameric membrane protein n=2 Tax=Pantoea TaxID=53335 RepID=UPI00197ECDB5|nr:hypothetical protein [Pantoea stewartii]